MSIHELSTISIFSDLTPEELTAIEHYVFEKQFKAGATLFVEGMKGEVFYIVKSGTVTLFKRNGEKNIPLTQLRVGQLVGVMALLDQEPRSATAKVTEAATLYTITKTCFQGILEATPQGGRKILMSILKIVNQRLRDTNHKLANAL